MIQGARNSHKGRTDPPGSGHLPDAQQQALKLRVVDELEHDQAASLMGTSEQNARARVSRALKTLSQRLQGVSR
jgi:DNA-directed RNA polymerase specialized sigma24 family protein